MNRVLTGLACLVAAAALVGDVQADSITGAGVSLSESAAAAYATGTTLYYNASSSGSFTVTADATAGSGIASVDFPTVFGSDSSTDSSSPFTSTYSWTAGASASGAKTVTINDGDGDSATAAFTVTPDTAPTVAVSGATEASGAADQYFVSATKTVYFRPAATGSLTVAATAADSETGIAQVVFPDLSGTAGWSGAGGTSTSSPFASTTYAWTANAAAPGAKTVTATNGTGMTATDTITFTADSSTPTGQAVALSGGPWYTTASVPLTLTAGTDTGSGVDSTRAVVERASAPLTNGTCGTFGSFAAVTLSGGADTSVTSGNCFRYQSKATDNVGNVSSASTASSDAKVDTTPPAVPSLTLAGTANAVASGSTLFYRPGATATFTVTAASAEPESGIASYTFPTIAGFTSVGSGATRSYLSTSAPSTAPPAASVTVTNGAGQTSGAASFTLVPDGKAPTLTVLCNGKACSSKPYAKAVKVSLVAADAGGAGVGVVSYTLDGTAPTADNGNEYSKPFTVTSAAHLRAIAYDRAKNASTPINMRITSLADRLSFTAPVTVTVRAKRTQLQARVTASRNARVAATLRGRGLKKAVTWRFGLDDGASIVEIKLPAGIARKRTYTLAWVVTDGRTTVRRTTRVAIK